MNFPKPNKIEIHIQDIPGCEMLGKLKTTWRDFLKEKNK